MNPDDWENFDPNDPDLPTLNFSPPFAAQDNNQNLNLYQSDDQPVFSSQGSPDQTQNQYLDPDLSYQLPDLDEADEYVAKLLRDYQQAHEGKAGAEGWDLGEPMSHDHSFRCQAGQEGQASGDGKGQSGSDPTTSELPQESRLQTQATDNEGDSQMSELVEEGDDDNESLLDLHGKGSEIGDYLMAVNRAPGTKTRVVGGRAPGEAPAGVLTMPECVAQRAPPRQSQVPERRGRSSGRIFPTSNMTSRGMLAGGLGMPEPKWAGSPVVPLESDPRTSSTRFPFASRGTNISPFGGQAYTPPPQAQLPRSQFNGIPLVRGTGQNFDTTHRGSMFDPPRSQLQQRLSQFGGMGTGLGHAQSGFMRPSPNWRSQVQANPQPGQPGGYQIPGQDHAPQYDQFGNKFGIQGQPYSTYPGSFAPVPSSAPPPPHPPQPEQQCLAPSAGQNNASLTRPLGRWRANQSFPGDPRRLIDDGPQRQNEKEFDFRARIELVNETLGIPTKPYPPGPLPRVPRGTYAGSKAPRNTSDQRLAERGKEEWDHVVRRDTEADEYDPVYENITEAERGQRRFDRARVELGLLEIVRIEQARRNLRREPTPDPGEDSGDALYSYDLDRTYAKTKLTCNYCCKRRKGCSLTKDPRLPCEWCTKNKKRCQRMANFTRRIRGVPKPPDPIDHDPRPNHSGVDSIARRRSASPANDDRDRNFGQKGDETEDDENFGVGMIWDARDARRPMPPNLPPPSQEQQERMQEQQNEAQRENVYQAVRRIQPIDQAFIEELRRRLSKLPQTSRAPLRQVRAKPARAARRAQPPNISTGFAGNEEMSLRAHQEMQNALATHGINDRMDQPQQQASLISQYNAADAQNTSPFSTAVSNLNPPAHAIPAPSTSTPQSTSQNVQNPVRAQGGEPVRFDYQVERGLPNYAWNVILPEIRLPWDPVERDSQDDCKEDVNWFDKKQNIGNARDIQYQMCMNTGKNCEARSHGESPYAICENCRNRQDFVAISWQQQIKDVTRAWLCKGCADTIRRHANNFVIRGETCGCLDVLKKTWLCHLDRERGYANVKTLAAGINEIVLRNWGEKRCVFCFSNPEDTSSGIYSCKVCRVYVEGI
ncbi:hypothetical protein BGZ60DRAFT_533961 [Tricladium varicosporioides]|nr:hypothetical protein BGZ60DRAFT_533961 [Hymenoscyphus varicosporioides]